MGAGFENGINTFNQKNNRSITFFINYKPIEQEVIDLGKPFSDFYSVDLITFDNQLIALGHSIAQKKGNRYIPQPKYYDFTAIKWLRFDNPLGNELKNIISTSKGPLFLGIDKVYLNNDIIIQTANAGNFFYTNNKLFFIHSGKAIYQCTWQPSKQTISLNQCHQFRLDKTDKVLYTYTATKDKVFFWFNNGNSYQLNLASQTLDILNDRSAHIISNQVYASYKYETGTLLGQSPLGSLLHFKNQSIYPFKPMIPYTRQQARLLPEAQSIAAYLGEIYVGTWPWGVLWKYDRVTESWDKVFRGFTEPDMDDIPYYQSAKRAKKYHISRDMWGQRIESLVNVNNRLFISTSRKTPSPIKRHGIGPDETLQSYYGRVWAIHRPYQLTCQLRPANTAYLDFMLDKKKMTIVQNGKELCSQTIDGNKLLTYIRENSGEHVLKNGPFGQFAGIFLEKMWRPYNY